MLNEAVDSRVTKQLLNDGKSTPIGSRFIAGQKVLVLLTGPAKSIAASKYYQVEALGKVMPRPDALNVVLSSPIDQTPSDSGNEGFQRRRTAGPENNLGSAVEG